MEGISTKIETVSWRRVCPWLHLFQTFRIAFDLRKIILAVLGLILLMAGNWAFTTFLPFSSHQAAPAWPWQTDFGYSQQNQSQQNQSPLATVGELLDQPAKTLSTLPTNWRLVLTPFKSVFEPAVVLFQRDRSWSQIADAWTRLIWAAFVWAIFGAAITRIAAVQFARDERIGLREALGFSCSKVLSFVSAPALPLSGIAVLWLLCFLGGLFARIPGVGEITVGALFVIPLFLGFLMSMMLVGVAVGWPLMFATISVEGSDGFDGLSRSYSYLLDRPWYFLWLVVVAMTYGSVVIFFAWLVASLLVYIACFSVASGMDPQAAADLFRTNPPVLGGSGLIGSVNTNPQASTGSFLVGVWLEMIALMLVAFIHSYFWSATTVIYFLLRLSDDGTELNEVYLEPKSPQTSNSSVADSLDAKTVDASSEKTMSDVTASDRSNEAANSG